MEGLFYLMLLQLGLLLIGAIYTLVTGGTGTWDPFDPVEEDPGDEITPHRLGCFPLILILVSIPIAIYVFSWWSIGALPLIWGTLLPLYARIKTNRSLDPESKALLNELLNRYGFSLGKIPRLESKALGPGSIAAEPFSMRVWTSKQSLCVQILGIGSKAQLYIPWDDIDLIAETAILIEKRGEQLERVQIAYLSLVTIAQREFFVPWSNELSEVVRNMPNQRVIKR